ncbi:uncharacterized protein LOC116734828 [Xiphophorus hellerii]|uniref:uncharacterized protein LOC116734828 n=1 Tax=Xiphophorus hellerii TaxID=8084 RepID=UPI0013B3FF85|nr:uncharacterized protein LOC116734828 [Xiphophorus hellerii]
MDTWTVLKMLQYFLFASLVRSAPAGLPSNLPPEFRETALKAMTLGEKILKDISAAHAAAVKDFSLDSSTSNLQSMAVMMEIPFSPVIQAVSPEFPLETLVSHMLAGVQMYQNLLEVLSSKVSGLDDLRADLRDLLNHINKLKELAQLTVEVSDQNPSTNLASHLQNSHNVPVAFRLTFTRLRSFCHDLNRTFKHLSKLLAAGAR